MELKFPDIPFERYADDIVCRCTTEAQVQNLWRILRERFRACNVTLHPDKTRIVYCKDRSLKGTSPTIAFDFLGYTFWPRQIQTRDGRLFLGFNPPVSQRAAKAIRETIRGWGLARLNPRTLESIAGKINATVRGWIDCYGACFKSVLRRPLAHIDDHLTRWVMRKYKRFRGKWLQAFNWLMKCTCPNSGLFVHWVFLYGTPWFNAGRTHTETPSTPSKYVKKDRGFIGRLNRNVLQAPVKARNITR